MLVVVDVVDVVVLLVGPGGLLHKESGASTSALPESMHLYPAYPGEVEHCPAGVPSMHDGAGGIVPFELPPVVPKQLHFCSNGTIFVPMIR